MEEKWNKSFRRRMAAFAVVVVLIAVVCIVRLVWVQLL